MQPILQGEHIPGDGTVPADSAEPAFVPHPFKVECIFGAKHVDLSSDSGVIDAAISDLAGIVLP